MAPPLDPIASLRAALRGHYEIEREIGQGAFATVYLARDLKHERKVAVKVLHADPSSETGELRFIREIRLLARLQHPNILPLHDSGHVEALLYYVMPYVSGDTLRDRIDRERQLVPSGACNIARDVADALGYAHAQGIIHRDIKPENILLSAGHPVLADFGIARVIDLAGVRQLTRTGMGSPGTPAYMSPEQLLGGKELDGRSDTYSLGCVLFEMLTGKPPFAGKEGFVKRFTEDPPSPSSVRKDLPQWIDNIVTTALAKEPGDRYQTAQEFATALTAGETTFAEPHPGEHPLVHAIHHSAQPGPQDVHPKKYDSEEVRLALLVARREGIGKHISFSEEAAGAPWFAGVRKHRTSLAAAAGLLLVGALAIGRDKIPSLRNSLFAPDVDSTRIAVLPFAGNASRRDRERIANGLYASLSEWRGLNLVSDQDVVEAANADGTPTSTRAAAALARSLGVGRFIWGQVSADDPSHARAQLYDPSSNAPLKSVSFQETRDRRGFIRATNELLEIPNRPAAADGGDGKTTSYAAWTAYGRGHVALSSGDLASAESNFRDAVTADRVFGPARVWLAQTQSWRQPEGRDDWRDQIVQALGAPSGLSDRDRLIGVALSRLADRRYPEACASYAQITRADSLDFVGLYGLGQCHAFDSLVIPSVSSPSRWQFRARYSDAAASFMKALIVNPNAHSILSFEQLQELLPIASTRTRRGKNAAGAEFAAYPALIRDTVVFVPYPLIEFDRLPAREIASRQNAALARNLDVLLDFATDWTRGSNESAPAYQALADVLEARGEITRTRSAGMSAVQATEKAKQLAATPRDSLLAATSEAWLLFKQGEFARARMAADSLLKTPRNFTPEQAEGVIGLAALTGKIGKTAELARLAPFYAAAVAGVPIPVRDAAASFFAFSALGVCGDTIAHLERRLDEQITHNVAEDQQIQVSTAAKARSLSMQASCTHGRATLGIQATGNKLLKMQHALASSDTGTLRSMLLAVTNDGKTQRPGDIALDFAYQISWLRAAIGDTAGAARQLDLALGSLPGLSPPSLREPASAAAAGRSMALRADIAAARGDVDERRRWASALVSLWATADAPLQPVVTRMRLLAAPNYQR